LIGAFQAFQSALAISQLGQLFQQGFFPNHDGGQPGTCGNPEIEIRELPVVSHQGWPR
jgi:hypothetical protein